MSIHCPPGMARQAPSGSSSKPAARSSRYFLQGAGSGSRLSGSRLSVHFIRWWLRLSAHSVISAEGYKAFKTHPCDG